MIEELKSKLDAQAASKKDWLSRVIKLHLLKANQQEEETIQEAYVRTTVRWIDSLCEKQMARLKDISDFMTKLEDLPSPDRNHIIT